MVKTAHPVKGGCVQSLVSKLRSHMPRVWPKNKSKIIKKIFKVNNHKDTAQYSFTK